MEFAISAPSAFIQLELLFVQWLLFNSLGFKPVPEEIADKTVILLFRSFLIVSTLTQYLQTSDLLHYAPAH